MLDKRLGWADTVFIICAQYLLALSTNQACLEIPRQDLGIVFTKCRTLLADGIELRMEKSFIRFNPRVIVAVGAGCETQTVTVLEGAEKVFQVLVIAMHLH